MVKFKNQPPTPEAPQVDPATGIKLLQQQLEKGKALLANRPLTSDPYDAWELLTGNYLEKAFGRNSPNVSRVLDVGKYGFMPEGEVAWENHRADSLKTQLSQIEDLIELLGTENQLRGKGRIALEAEPKGHRIFIVHGHDKLTLEQTARFLEHLDQEVVILHEQPNQGRTIIEKFEDYSNVGFAVILLTPDDRGGTITEPYESQKPRARQNVILELGFFLGRLGRDRVCALYRSETEIPSDYSGVLYTKVDEAGGWKLELAKEIKAAGLPVDMNKAL